jgi:hypothetical protein
MAGERGGGGRRGLVSSSEATALAVFDGDDTRERGVGLGRGRTGDLARASRSCSGARLEAEVIDGARRDAGRWS